MTRKQGKLSEPDIEEVLYNYVDSTFSDAELSSREADQVISKIMKKEDLSRYRSLDDLRQDLPSIFKNYI